MLTCTMCTCMCVFACFCEDVCELYAHAYICEHRYQCMHTHTCDHAGTNKSSEAEKKEIKIGIENFQFQYGHHPGRNH